MPEAVRMLNALNTDTQVQEPDSGEIDALVTAEQNEQTMRNMCSDDLRSFI